jgi:hypothetical protein
MSASGQVLPLNPDGMVTLPGGQTIAVKNEKLVDSIYGNLNRRSEGSTFEAKAPGGRANGVVQGYILLPAGIVGMKDGGKDEGTIILKDNHGPGGDMNKQYKIWFEYKRGGKVDGIVLRREHEHPDTEEIDDVKYENQPHLEPGDKLEYKASYQDTNDGGVRLRMDYKDPKTGQWKRLFDHVDHGDGKKDRPYRGESGVQDGTRVDGRVGGSKPSEEDQKKYRRIAEGKPIGTTNVTEIEDILSKLAISAIWAREIEPDNSDLRDGKDDPLSFGPKGD